MWQNYVSIKNPFSSLQPENFRSKELLNVKILKTFYLVKEGTKRHSTITNYKYCERWLLLCSFHTKKLFKKSRIGPQNISGFFFKKQQNISVEETFKSMNDIWAPHPIVAEVTIELDLLHTPSYQNLLYIFFIWKIELSNNVRTPHPRVGKKMRQAHIQMMEEKTEHR